MRAKDQPETRPTGGPHMRAGCRFGLFGIAGGGGVDNGDVLLQGFAAQEIEVIPAQSPLATRLAASDPATPSFLPK